MNSHQPQFDLYAAPQLGSQSYWFWYLFTIPGFRAR